MSSVVSFKAPEELVERIDEEVDRGAFTSRGELLRSIVRNMESRRLSEKARKDIQEGREQEGRPLDEL